MINTVTLDNNDNNNNNYNNNNKNKSNNCYINSTDFTKIGHHLVLHSKSAPEQCCLGKFRKLQNASSKKDYFCRKSY